MNFPLRLPLLLLILGLALPGCVHLHPDFMADFEGEDSGFRHHDDDGDDDEDGDRDGLERHIRDLEETLQELEHEMDKVHQELDEAHREMDRRHERNDDDREEHRRDDDRRDENREEHRRDEDREEHRRDDDRRDEDREEHRRDEDRRDEDREEHRRDDDRRDEDRDRDFHPRDDGPDGERRRVERFESNGELPMGDFKFGRTGVRAFQVGMPGNRGPEGRRIGQRDQRTRDGGGLGAENRNRRNDRDRARGRQMRPQQRPGGDPRALPSRNREGRGNEQDRNRDDRNRDDRNRGDRNRGNNDQDQQQIHWSGSLEEMPDHILEMLKNLDVDIPFDRAGAGESHVEIEVSRSEHSDGPEGDKSVKRRYVEVDSGRTFEFDLGKDVRGAPLIPGESVAWIGDHSMPSEVHIIRVGSDLPPGNKKAGKQKTDKKKAINKRKTAARKKVAKKKAGNKKAGKQKIDKQQTDKKKASNKKKAAARKKAAMKKKAGNKKTGKKKTDKKKSDKKKAVEVESGATFQIVVGGTDGEESNVTFGSTDGLDPDQQSIHYESVEEMPDHIREMFEFLEGEIESLELIPLEEVLGDLDEAPAKKKTDKKKSDKKKTDKKKKNKETDKKKDDVTLEGRIVL